MNFIDKFKNKCRMLDNPFDTPIKPTIAYEEPPLEVNIELYEVRKLFLPVDAEFPYGRMVLYNVTKKEADWWIENKLKAKVFVDDVTETKTLVFYEKFLIGAQPKQRNIYINPKKFCTEEFPDFKTPKRIN